MALSLVRSKPDHKVVTDYTSAFRNLIYVQRDKRYDVDNRPYLPVLLESSAVEFTMKCGRQIGKTVAVLSRILLYNGSWGLARDIRLGDKLAAMTADGAHMGAAAVTWVSDLYEKPCLRITTRMGHVLDLATTHPVRQWDRWTPAGDLKVGDRVAAMRGLPNAFTGSCRRTAARIALTAYLLGDGGLTQSMITFKALPGPKIDGFMQHVLTSKLGHTPSTDKCSGATNIVLLKNPDDSVYQWLLEDGLRWPMDAHGHCGPLSEEKFIPDWVFDLSRENTALFLNRLWSTDGHVKQVKPSLYDVSYSSTSARMIKQVQALLWKFGIPSSIRTKWPAYHKRRGVKKYAYELRVETQDGIKRFLTDVGALGKSEGVPLPGGDANNNRDTYPIEVGQLISQIIATRGEAGRYGCRADSHASLRTAGLRKTLKYPPSRQKLQEYVDFFRADPRYDRALVDQLAQHTDTDLVWDTVETIEPLGTQTCVDFSVEDVHNFIVEGVVTHNSTKICGILQLHGITTPGYPHMYITPRGDQAKDISRNKFSTMMRESPYLSRFVPNQRSRDEAWQLGMKMLTNGAHYYFMSAYHTADAIRGRSAGYIVKDEIQDLIADHMAPIDECAANFPDARFLNSGTPKTFQNLLEQKWQRSTQAEWLVKCDACGNWCFQDHRMLGKTGYVCPRCGKPVQISNGMWVMGNPERFDVHQGFRVTQFMNPNTQYRRLIEKFETYPFSQFCNEVLGLSYAEGDVVLTREDMLRACDDKTPMLRTIPAKFNMIVHGGVDHGTGNMAAKRARGLTQSSFTVVATGGFDPSGKFRILSIKRLTGSDTDLSTQPSVINGILHNMRCKFVIADWGFGAPNNRRMINEFGWSPTRYLEIQESDSLKQFVAWNDQAARYIVNRNEMFMKIIDDIKNQRIIFPRREDMEPFIQDFTSIYAELDADHNKRRYDHTQPDDAFHAVAFCYLAAALDAGVLSRFNVEPDVS